MAISKFTKLIISKQANIILIWFVIAMIIPNIILSITEKLTAISAISNILLPLGIYTIILCKSKNAGTAVLALFPFTFLCAFQMVLIFLYGGSIIGVDMFLNLVTTSASEAGELLGNLGIAVGTVIILYLPPILLSISNIARKDRVKPVFRKACLKTGCITTAISIVFLALSYLFLTDYSISRDLFPVNVIRNMATAVKRIHKNNIYPQTSAGFRFNAKSTRPGVKELYVVVIGETGRADNFQLLGYNRPTNPKLSKRNGIIAFSHVLSESNTTHKSVPMLLSTIDASNADSLQFRKSIITAFKEAGFKTSFISSQPLNRSYIDYFGNEANFTNFINAERSGIDVLKDEALIPEFKRIIENSNAQKEIIFIHIYGSHFNYNDRYDRKYAKFLPDESKNASIKNKENLINAYDNTIVAIDSFLDQIIDQLANLQGYSTALMYVPDHGEDLFDDNRERFLHSSPTPTFWQLHVPMILWFSPMLKAEYPSLWDNASLNVASQISSSRSFPYTILDISGVTFPEFKQNYSITSKNYSAPQRYYLSDRNECLLFKKSGLAPVDFCKLKQDNFSY